jgi:outer membrane receptor protein involved in Fe transport
VWAAVVALWPAATASAQETQLEEIIVTGTRIARPDFVSASPIISVSQERLAETASSTIDGVLNSLPQFVPNANGTSNNPANGGQANLSLRGLPTTATLVLLNGRRLMPANGNGVVDVNIVPPALIESVEVITGGASAVYGSDAVAGVVNFKLRQDFDGVELDAGGAVTDQGDGDEYSVGLSAGTDFADGRGSLMGYIGYTDRAAITYADRASTRYGLQYAGIGNGTTGPRNAFVPSGSPTIDEGRVNIVPSRAAFESLFLGYGYPAGTPPYSQALPNGRQVFNRQIGINDDGSIFTMGILPQPVPGGVANYRGPTDYPVAYNDRTFGYNFAPPNYLQLPLERSSAFLRTDFEFSELAQVYAEALYADYSVSTQLAPTPVMDVTFPVTNPYISPDLAFLLASRSSPLAPVDFRKRMTALGPRQSQNNYDVYLVTVGVEGRIGASWRYDAYLQTGQNENEEIQNNNVRRSRYEELLYAPDGGRAICGGYDPFGYAPISDECAAYVAVNGTNQTRVTQRIAELSFSGPVFELPAGQVQIVIGAMHKRDSFKYAADPISQSFLPDGRSEVIGFSASDDVDGEDNNTDLYVETSIPLLRDLPGVQSLETVLGYRWSDYESAGGIEAYKAELLYRPVEAVRLRGSYQHAVRAPSVFELYLPQLGPSVEVDFQNPDPCNFDSPERSGPNAAQVEALCLAQGLPADLLPEYLYTELEVDGVVGGNPDLGPETGDTYTAGVVIQSMASNRWLERLQVSVDWYDIEVVDAILTPPAAAFIPRCYDPVYNPKLTADGPYCSFFERDPVSGEIRNAKEIFRNIGSLRTSGIDLQLDWGADVGPGIASLNWLVSWIDSLERQGGKGSGADELVGQARGVLGGSVAEWRWNLRVAYAWSGLEAALQWRYIDSLEASAPPDNEIWKVPSQDYFDFYVSYAVDDGLFAGMSLHAGVENLTNVNPPIFPGYVQANTDPSIYDVLGRKYFARATYRF